MTDATTMTDTEVLDAPVEEAVATEPKKEEVKAEAPQRGRGRNDRRGGGRPRERRERERSEFDQATIDVRRVARVMAGGRRFSFSVVVVIGDKKGRVGVGIGKAADTALAIDKATRDAKKHMITVPRTKNGSIRHNVSITYGSVTITMVPSPGRGVVAGSAMRTVLELAGVGDVVAKILTRSKNKLTIARATIAALKSLKA